jgi:hypothetical protein
LPIPGTTKIAHMEENLGALDVQLSAEEQRALTDGFARIAVQGARSAEQQLALVDDGAKLGTRSKGGQGRSPLPATKRLGDSLRSDY